MRLADRHTGMETLNRTECFRLLDTAPVGRFVAIVGGAPHIVPVNHVVDGETVVFRSDPGTKLDNVDRGRVAFEADSYDLVSRTGWSVVVHGVAEEVTSFDDPELWHHVQNLPIDPWGGGEKAHWIRVHAASVTGRRIRH